MNASRSSGVTHVSRAPARAERINSPERPTNQIFGTGSSITENTWAW